MSDIEVTLKLPEELLKRVKAAGLQIEDLPSLIDEQLKQREQLDQVAKQTPIRSLTDLADRIAALPDDIKPRPEDIEQAIHEAREEIAEERRARKLR